MRPFEGRLTLDPHLQSSVISANLGRLPCRFGVLQGCLVHGYSLLQGVLEASGSCRGRLCVLGLHLSNKRLLSPLRKNSCSRRKASEANGRRLDLRLNIRWDKTLFPGERINMLSLVLKRAQMWDRRVGRFSVLVTGVGHRWPYVRGCRRAAWAAPATAGTLGFQRGTGRKRFQRHLRHPRPHRPLPAAQPD